ncbi:MAG TPA: histidine kinase [Gemmatimonadaceae bacterium]|jgi:two-component system LytT family sensor kinase|nr:histidine kinase [Gemmatimonadaceae bacterium]
MTPNDTTTLVHLVGFLAGVVLYAMLAVMTVRQHAAGDRIALATAVLGLAWNSVALVIYGLHDLGLPAPLPRAWPWIVALAFCALGFLPAVVVHSAVQSAAQSAGRRRGGRALVSLAYGLSTVAGALQLIAAGRGESLPSRAALQTTSIGFSVLIIVLALFARRQPGWRRALTAVALAAFAVMALHLSQHTAGTESWPTELLGHHASLPLALVILYQDYRFAFADLFLKRVLTVVALLAITVALYRIVIATQLVAVLVGLWVATALAYPWLRRLIYKGVDRLILRRADYTRVRAEVTSCVAALDLEPQILDAACEIVRIALTARQVTWTTTPREGTVIRVPTTEEPIYFIEVHGLAAGRRLLSDDLAMLEAVALIVARRIDAVRVTRERYGRDLREREILQLATEAQLTALRAQLNPHFLFNALTTIGYLMEAAPQRALETLFRLTGLLRAVLKRSDGELGTLADELEIIRSYLGVEAARFEERLAVTIDVPADLSPVPLPPLILQPLVENAIKHGITPRKEGGRLVLSARRDGPTMIITILDTGVGVSAADLAQRRARGIGLSNVEARLAHYYGDAASIAVRSAPGVGTTIEVRVPVEHAKAAARAG